MAYAATTLATLKSRLSQLVGGQGRFWSAFEQEVALNEALSIWHLMVGEFSYAAFATGTAGENILMTLFNPATGATPLYVYTTGTATTTAPVSLSINRVGTVATQTTETGVGDAITTSTRSTYPKLTQVSVPDLDYQWGGWHTATTSVTEYWAPWGLNQMVVPAIPSSEIRVDYYRADRLLVADADYIQLGDEELNKILAYALWQLNFKSGTEEAFKNTAPLRELFLFAATTRNQRLRSSQLYRDFMGADYGVSQSELLKETIPQKAARG